MPTAHVNHFRRLWGALVHLSLWAKMRVILPTFKKNYQTFMMYQISF